MHVWVCRRSSSGPTRKHNSGAFRNTGHRRGLLGCQTRCKFPRSCRNGIFLTFVGHARRYPAFKLRMRTEITGLIQEYGQFSTETIAPDGPLEVHGDLMVGADIVTDSSSKSRTHGARFGARSMLWMRLSWRRRPELPMGR